ncbi:MAG: S9 family peptidase, partial [Planctomycetales bacterium]|nr:S9 family peptidase [Planctomycetales bacterium]
MQTPATQNEPFIDRPLVMMRFNSTPVGPSVLRTPYLVLVVFALLLANFTSHVAAADDNKKPEKPAPELTLERIFSGSEFNAKDAAYQWKDEQSFWNWDSSAGGLQSIDASTGEATTIVSTAELTPAGQSQPLRVESFEWSAQNDKLLLFTNSQRVWRQRTRGDYWVYDRTSRILSKLGGDEADAASLMFAKFSPDGQQVAYVRDRRIYIEDLRDRSVRCITPTEDDSIINGTFDWVYEEELALRDGFRWSPDGQSIAFWQLDTSGVSQFTMLNNTDEFYPQVIQFAYPKAGQINSSCRIGIYHIKQNNTVWPAIPGDARNHYLCRMQWRNGDELIVQQLNRLQNQLKIFAISAKQLEVREVLHEQDECWVDVHDELFWVSDKSHFTWVSERSGWRDIYWADPGEGTQNRITPGQFDVMQLLGMDEDQQRLFFLASPENPTQAYLYRVNFDGGDLQRVTPADQPGTHQYVMSPESGFAIHRWSAFDRVPRVELIRLADHSVVRKLETNKDLRKKMKRLKRPRQEFIRVEIEPGVELDGWCIYPLDFDEQKKYPLLLHVYGEPAGQTVLDRWQGSNYLWHLMLAQQGYCVISLDNRGTPAPRGRAWRKSIYRQIGQLAAADQAAAVRKLLADRPYLDAERVGVWGWSGGGSMSLHAILKYADLYGTAISIAPVANQRYYDTIYQE